MKKLISLLLIPLMLISFAACKKGDTPEIVGSWYFVGEDYPFLEFKADGTATCQMIPEVEYKYSFDGEYLTLTTDDFTLTYDCIIDENGYLTYTWFDNGTPVKETCEKR